MQFLEHDFSNFSKGAPCFSTLARSTAPSQALIRKDASTVASQSTRISPCRCPSRTVGLGVSPGKLSPAPLPLAQREWVASL